MKIVVTTKDEEMTVFEGEKNLNDISINCHESDVFISNHKCNCLLDMILDRAYKKSLSDSTFMAEIFDLTEVEKIEITMG